MGCLRDQMRTPGSTNSPGANLDARQRGPEGVPGRDARHNLSRRATYKKAHRKVGFLWMIEFEKT